jgi:hypothetical protein
MPEMSKQFIPNNNNNNNNKANIHPDFDEFANY